MKIKIEYDKDEIFSPIGFAKAVVDEELKTENP